MSNAFKCDRCGEFETGKPERRRARKIGYGAANTPENTTLAEPDLCEGCAALFDGLIGEFLSGTGEEKLVTDGGQDREDLIEEHGEEAVVELDDPFISGAESFIHDRQYDAEPELAIEDACTECGGEAYHFRCPSCGRPLCSKHQELGAGFCSDYAGEEEGCQIGEEGESA